LRWGNLGPTPEDAWANREVHQEILAALRELPPATRETVIGFYLQGYSYQELAELLGTPLSTVRVGCITADGGCGGPLGR
jgi:RNA polymerase sigma factor (sigma-70 family)